MISESDRKYMIELIDKQIIEEIKNGLSIEKQNISRWDLIVKILNILEKDKR